MPVWEIQADTSKAICRICEDGRIRSIYNCAAHEETPAHLDLLEHRRNQEAGGASGSTAELTTSQISEDALRNLLSSFTGGTVDPYPAPHAPSPGLGLSWNAYDADIVLPLSADEQAVADIAGSILERFDFHDLPESEDDEFEERSDHEDLDVPEPIVGDAPGKIFIFQSSFAD